MFFIENDKMGFTVPFIPGNFRGLSPEFMVDRSFNMIVSPLTFSKEHLFSRFFECDYVYFCRPCPPAAKAVWNKGNDSINSKIRNGFSADPFVDIAAECLEIFTDLFEYESPLVNFEETLVWEYITEPEAEEFIFQSVKPHLAFVWTAFSDRDFTIYQSKIYQHFKVFCQGVCLEAQFGGNLTNFTFSFSDDLQYGEVVDRFCNLLR